jgi:hypothetical protein
MTALERLQAADRQAVRRALVTHQDAHHNQNSFITGSLSEVIYVNRADYTPVASTASEATLLAGLNEQCVFPAAFFLNPSATRRAVRITARGVFSTTGTPTMIFQARLNTTAGAAVYTGTSVGVTAAITTGSGVSNQWFELIMDLVCATPGIGTGSTTLICNGRVSSPGGFASPFSYAVLPTTPPTATWTATVDGAVTSYLGLSMTWSASSASNTITLKELLCQGLN